MIDFGLAIRKEVGKGTARNNGHGVHGWGDGIGYGGGSCNGEGHYSPGHANGGGAANGFGHYACTYMGRGSGDGWAVGRGGRDGEK